MKSVSYVAGLLFHFDSVLMVQKTRPDWQKGLLNAVGGKVEEAESLEDAMKREFVEETKIVVEVWEHFCSEYGPDYNVHFFKAMLPSFMIRPQLLVANDVGETLHWVQLSSLLRTWPNHRIVGNLAWLLPLARDWRKFTQPVIARTEDAISSRPTW